jgi:hypothetical protein
MLNLVTLVRGQFDYVSFKQISNKKKKKKHKNNILENQSIFSEKWNYFCICLNKIRFIFCPDSPLHYSVIIQFHFLIWGKFQLIWAAPVCLTIEAYIRHCRSPGPIQLHSCKPQSPMICILNLRTELGNRSNFRSNDCIW